MDLGLLHMPLWGYVVVTLAMTHLTIIAVTLFLHRSQAHRAVDLHPIVSHVLRLWLWLSTGMDTRAWVAIHRKHHAFVETKDDPHSPQVQGIRKVLLEGAELYRAEAKCAETIEKYGHGTPDDWIERNLYHRYSNRGYFVMMGINLLLFGPLGLTIWAIQMMWIPLLAAGVINGIGHYAGYRKFETADTSSNIVPWGILVGGEELHNNHHAFASSARFSCQWWEFDIGWLYIRLLQAVGLARVKKVAPRPHLVPGKVQGDIDVDTVRAVISNRFQVMAQYARTVLVKVHRDAVRDADVHQRDFLKRARRLLVREESLLNDEAQVRLQQVLEQNQTLATVYNYKQRLQSIWQERSANHESLLASLQEWCHEAEASGIRALQDFARTLPAYSLRPAVA